MAKRYPRLICLLEPGTYKKGDPPPSGYIQWHEWAKVQHRSGLRQKRCPVCGLWRFPQELPCCEKKA